MSMCVGVGMPLLIRKASRRPVVSRLWGGLLWRNLHALAAKQCGHFWRVRADIALAATSSTNLTDMH